MEYKDFLIYTRSGGFINFEKLDTQGKELYAIFKVFKDKQNPYFHRVNSIKVTSQDRPGDKGAHGKTGKACDIVIDPPEYMPYYAGILHAIKTYNIYLGTYTQSGTKIIKNLHIHTDSDYSRRSNTLYYELNDKRLNPIDSENVKELLKIYGFGIIESIEDMGKFKKETIKNLLTDSPKSSKISINEFIHIPLYEKIMKFEEKAKTEIVQKASQAGYILLIAGGLFIGYKVYKNINKQG